MRRSHRNHQRDVPARRRPTAHAPRFAHAIGYPSVTADFRVTAVMIAMTGRGQLNKSPTRGDDCLPAMRYTQYLPSRRAHNHMPHPTMIPEAEGRNDDRGPSPRMLFSPFRCGKLSDRSGSEGCGGSVIANRLRAPSTSAHGNRTCHPFLVVPSSL